MLVPASDASIKIAQYASGYSTGNDPKHLVQVPSGHHSEWWQQGKADAQEERSRLIPRATHGGSIVDAVKPLYLDTTKWTAEDLELCAKLRAIVCDLDPKGTPSNRYSDIMKAGEALISATRRTLTSTDLATIKELVRETILETVAAERAAREEAFQKAGKTDEPHS